MFNRILRFQNVFTITVRGKGSSSHEWLQRQFADPYVEKAKIQNYRYLILISTIQ